MNGIRKRLAQGLVATTLLCAAAFLGCGALAVRGNAWERFCIVLMVVMLTSMLGAVGLVAATYLEYRADLRRHVDRAPLSDEEFLARLDEGGGAVAGDDIVIDLALVSRVRALAGFYFRGLGGDRFAPGDRLAEDLHLLDVAPFACRSFCGTLEDSLGLEREALRSLLAMRRLATFGDLIRAAAAFERVPGGPASDDGLAVDPARDGDGRATPYCSESDLAGLT